MPLLGSCLQLTYTFYILHIVCVCVYVCVLYSFMNNHSDMATRWDQGEAQEKNKTKFVILWRLEAGPYGKDPRGEAEVGGGGAALRLWSLLRFPQERKASLGAQMVKNLPTMQETWVRSCGAGNGNLLRYSCLEDSMNRGAWWATVHGVAKSQTWVSKRLTHTHTHTQGRQSRVDAQLRIV